MTGLIIALLVGGFLLVLLEAVVPGGVLGILGGLVLAFAVVLSFHEYGTAKGGWIFAGTAAAVFVVLYVGLRILPQTRMGRKMLLSQKVEGGPRDPALEQARHRLTGREGTVVTDLRPSGKGLIDGKRWDVVTDGSYIAKGASFRVVRVEGPRIVVSQVAVLPSRPEAEGRQPWDSA
ncbi:hypothetical protein AMJ85_04025 [candidate division BRC1 bacterium SM23_51]|nr:MAG: hypothetical protein AMJ85_04025 [candidate division BRC1 bacterium SM23_51]